MRVPQKHLLFRQRACFPKASWQSKAILRKAMSSGSHEYLGKGIVNYDRPDLQKIMNESTSHTEAINRDNWIGAE